ncbi:NAD(P)H dependent 6'-deoxychalcone synthase family protein [Populus alba x Populus x berolinensis]|uniref:NAD(P)H dependent 6'-deoxychalcone synthase family protein n=1 Tax=Populus alba x Populus x berolinensis TaxID=444605 RepID=A0AAD6MNU1_9ROSI|nr:NAD(P)H dependent 6'-deoxychalcone synthase family protein [Populus alba x Populus x berolinensis]
MDNESVRIPEVVLVSSDGRSMPVLGMGTSASPLEGSDETKTAILQAIEIGHRHFDTATLYLTEEPLGEAISEALSRGLIRSRDELFITSKLWCSDAHGDLVLPALKKSLRNLQLEYLDLYLIHWPVSSRSGTYEFPINKGDLLPMDFKSVWEAINFSCKKLSDILAFAKIPPAVNQVEINPLWQQKKLREFCEAKAPLGTRGTIWGSNRVMENEVLREIATAKGKSVAQVCLRWAFEQGVCVVLKSFNKGRMKENLEILNWTLSEEESRMIGDIPQSRGCRGEDYISEKGPIKTIEELWDGEI